jgi:serine/threonine protein kinase
VDPTNAEVEGLRPHDDADSSEIRWQDVQRGKLLAEGAFGAVYAGKVHGTEAAIKVMRGRRRRATMGEIRKEVEVLRLAKHPHVALFMGMTETPNGDPVMLMELMQGDLEAYLRQHSQLSVFERLEIARQVATGLGWLHSMEPSIVHLDLKLESMLFFCFYVCPRHW